jgi:hypothetical protein
MKNILIVLFSLLTVSLVAQDFEGVITWKFEQEMDAATKARMDQAQQKMNDPATQAQLKEMREKMNDPEFKKMMESNPQMKQQMEQILKMSEGAASGNSLFPKSMVLKIKDRNTLSTTEGGIMSNYEILSLKNNNTTYRIDRDAKTYSVMSSDLDSMKMSDVKITKTGETTKILTYPCTKYIAEMTIQGQPVKQIFWATTAIKGLDMKTLAQQNFGGGNQALFYEKIEGVPLKVEMKNQQFGFIMEAVSVERKSLPASDFAIPQGFKQTNE